MRWPSLAVPIAIVATVGCRSRAPDATPEGAFDEFLAACESASVDPKASARAFALLAPSVRQALEERARRASSITGKAATPEQMLVPAWTPIRFEISKTTTTLDATGTKATLDVYGVDPTTQHVKVPMVREGESWRVSVVLP